MDAPVRRVLKTSEWLSYAVHCTGAGSYNLQVKTSGPPVYLVFIREDRFHPIYDTYPVPATLHLELDGQDVTGPTEVQENLVFPRIRITEGPHQLRLVMDHVADARPRDVGYHGQWFHLWPRNAVAVDWIQSLHLSNRAIHQPGPLVFGRRADQPADGRHCGRPKFAGRFRDGSLDLVEPPRAPEHRVLPRRPAVAINPGGVATCYRAAVRSTSRATGSGDRRLHPPVQAPPG